MGELVCITEVAVEALAQGLENVWGVGRGEGADASEGKGN